MPTYNYRLTGRDIKTLSPVESTDRVLLWGADSIHCSAPGCRFEICAVGGENVMGGAMQEGWGLKDYSPECREIDVNIPPPANLEEAQCLSPWRCALHLTDEHKLITPEMIAEHCPGPPSPEYQRGHADGFECGSKAAKRPLRGFVPGPGNTVMDIPSAEELRATLDAHGGPGYFAQRFQMVGPQFTSTENGEKLIEALAGLADAPKLTVLLLFVTAMMLTAQYYNDKYAVQIQAAIDNGASVQ